MNTRNNSMIIRDSLMALFEEMSNERITYVCAPAGYGKTVAVRQWLDSISCAKATISLDEYDNNPAHFCLRFCEALCSCQPHNGLLSEILSHPAFNSAPDEYVLRAITALLKKKRAVVVIDDLHFIRNNKVQHMLFIFLKRLPETFKIVLISRNDLPPGFSELWIKGHLKRITAEQLSFSSEEIMMLYKKRGTSITQEKAKSIHRFTDGWAIGINAVLLSGNGLSGKNLDFLEEFIRLNVWEKWDESTHRFMLNTAAARALHPALCTVLTGIGDSKKLLNKLMHGGAFVYQTSDGVYHFHHLFHDFLKNMLAERGDGYLFPLLEKEGQWYLSRQDFYSAMDCFIRCESYEGIAKAFSLLAQMKHYDFVVEKLLPVIKSPMLIAVADKFPSLYSMLSWAALAEGRADDAAKYMDIYFARYSEVMAGNASRVHGIFLLRLLDFRTPLGDIESAVTALSYVPDQKYTPRSITMHMPFLHRSTRDFSELAAGNTDQNILKMKRVIGWLFGEKASLLAETLTAGLLYEQGALDKAHMHTLTANAEIKEDFDPESKFCAMSVFVNILDALGQTHEAAHVLKCMADMIEQNRAYYLNRNFHALTVRRKLGNGDIDAARTWLGAYDTAMYDNVSLHGIYFALTTCRAYITSGDYDSAVIQLTKVLELATAYNRPLDIIEAQILLSIAYWKKKRSFQGEALRHLEDAVSLAYSFHYTQMFVNDGAELFGMLHRLHGRAEQLSKTDGTPISFIKMLYLKTLEPVNSGLTSKQTEQPLKYTDKQKTVMKLLCDGKSYREITEVMGIKLPTLRSHIALIYKKLDVTSGLDAVKKIQMLGLLEDK